jgi:uncharacterized protein YbjQ (UPF0145 family)
MKLKEIAAKYGVNNRDFEAFVRQENIPVTYTFASIAISDNDVDAVVQKFKAENERKEKEAAEEKERAEKEAVEEKVRAERKKRALAEMLITSGFNFDGYTITKYSGYISGDDAVSVERGLAIFGSGINVKDRLMASLATIRRNALRELKEAAYALGCNAVIGVDFDYLTLDPQTASLSGRTAYQPYVFGVTANGNAVVIEKNSD